MIINISGAFVIGFLSRYFVIDWDDRYGTFLQSAILIGLQGVILSRWLFKAYLSEGLLRERGGT